MHNKIILFYCSKLSDIRQTCIQLLVLFQYIEQVVIVDIAFHSVIMLCDNKRLVTETSIDNVYRMCRICTKQVIAGNFRNGNRPKNGVLFCLN